ncbi:HAD-IA family hydrolase [Microbispora sp. NPDC088329]|uniref:HAD-IA family hydrolase n=1 Tax=Microbispora sp. NPDC088329 TaxID=3154869 RepID=UPI003449EC6A
MMPTIRESGHPWYAWAVTIPRPYDAVLCDFDGVIRFFDQTELTELERTVGLAEGATMKVLFAPEVDRPALLGQITVERAGVPVERCLFVDDRAENVEAAGALGMTAVLFTGVPDLEAALAPLPG